MFRETYFLLLGSFLFFFTACQEQDTKTSDAESVPSVEAVSNTSDDVTTFQIVPSATRVHWEGYKPAMGVTHTGTVDISKGEIFVKDNMITGGNFTIDFTTITDTDLEGNSKMKLEAHLKGTTEGKEDDFFNVDKYPTGLFEITRVTSLTGDASANAMIYGNLTIKGITRNVGFTANVNIDEGVITATTPLFKIDRTEFGIQVLSKKFFENLKDNFVSDEFGVRIDLRAETGKDI